MIDHHEGGQTIIMFCFYQQLQLLVNFYLAYTIIIIGILLCIIDIIVGILLCIIGIIVGRRRGLKLLSSVLYRRVN